MFDILRAGHEGWKAHVEATTDVVTAEVDDLLWADVMVFDAPTRYGNVPSQFQQFLAIAEVASLLSPGDSPR